MVICRNPFLFAHSSCKLPSIEAMMVYVKSEVCY